MTMKIIPTVFAKNKKEFDYRFSKLIKVTNNMQIDFMDGKFVSAKSMSLFDVPNLKKYHGQFEAHLMVKKPSSWIRKVKKKGFRKVLFHYNTDDPVKVIAESKRNGLKVFIVLNPEDRVRDVCYLFDLVDGVLVMGVHPGKEKQSLIKTTFKKIKEIRKINSNIDIQVDGGVNMSNVRRLVKSGANLINSGSFIACAENPKEALKMLKRSSN